MDKNDTLVKPAKKLKTTRLEKPRTSVIENILNYSKSLDVIQSPFVGSFVFVNN